MEFIQSFTLAEWIGVAAGIVFVAFIVKKVKNSRKSGSGTGGTGGSGGGTRPNNKLK